MRRHQPMEHHPPVRRRRLDFDQALREEEVEQAAAAERQAHIERRNAAGQAYGIIPTMIPRHEQQRDMWLWRAHVNEQQAAQTRDPYAAEYNRHRAAVQRRAADRQQRRINDIHMSTGRRQGTFEH